MRANSKNLRLFNLIIGLGLLFATSVFSYGRFTWSEIPQSPTLCQIMKRALLALFRTTPALESAHGISIVREIGEGAMGEVWQGQGRNNRGEMVPLIIKSAKLRGDQALEREYQVLRHLYPGRVRRLEADGRVYVVTEVFSAMPAEADTPAPTLDTWMGTNRSSTRAQKSTIQTALLNELEFIHSRRVIHSDIKPQNILIQQDAEGTYSAKFIDFGMATHGEHTPLLPNRPVAFGTPIYMSREAFRGREATTERDVRALQRVLLELQLGGRLEQFPNLIYHRYIEGFQGDVFGICFRRTFDQEPNLIAPELAFVLQSHIPRDVPTLKIMINEASNPNRFLAEYARRWQRAFAERTDRASRDELVLEIVRSANLGPRLLPLLTEAERDAIERAGRRLIVADTPLEHAYNEFHPDQRNDIEAFVSAMAILSKNKN